MLCSLREGPGHAGLEKCVKTASEREHALQGLIAALQKREEPWALGSMFAQMAGLKWKGGHVCWEGLIYEIFIPNNHTVQICRMTSISS